MQLRLQVLLFGLDVGKQWWSKRKQLGKQISGQHIAVNSKIVQIGDGEGIGVVLHEGRHHALFTKHHRNHFERLGWMLLLVNDCKVFFLDIGGIIGSLTVRGVPIIST